MLLSVLGVSIFYFHTLESKIIKQQLENLLNTPLLLSEKRWHEN